MNFSLNANDRYPPDIPLNLQNIVLNLREFIFTNTAEMYARENKLLIYGSIVASISQSLNLHISTPSYKLLVDICNQTWHKTSFRKGFKFVKMKSHSVSQRKMVKIH